MKDKTMALVLVFVCTIFGGVLILDDITKDKNNRKNQPSAQSTTAPSPSDGKWTPVPACEMRVIWPEGITLVSWRQDANGTNIMEYRDAKDAFHVAEFKFVPITNGDSSSGQIQFKVGVELVPGTTRPGIDVQE